MQSHDSSEVLRRYRADLADRGGGAQLTREQEYELAKRHRAGERNAGLMLVKACLPFVITIAKEYRRWGTPLEDLIQQGNLGLLKAVEKFDPAHDCRLATYAAYWIRAEIREYVVRSYRVVRLGTTKGERKVLRLYRRTGESNPAALASASGLSEARVRELLPLISAREVRLAGGLQATDAEGRDSIEARLPSPNPSPEDETSSREMAKWRREDVAKALSRLPEREQLIVKVRLMNDDPVTLEQLGVMLGVSKERVRQLEDRARTRLRGELFEYAKAG
ncbi:MAG: sigma-70 family RNA polymerase sigma factor [Polyangiaceae bacterium]